MTETFRSHTTPQPLINLLDVVCAHTRTSDGGDLYLTYYGLLYADLLQPEICTPL